MSKGIKPKALKIDLSGFSNKKRLIQANSSFLFSISLVNVGAHFSLVFNITRKFC